MYSLDPWTDPHGALLHLEIGAVRAGMGSWLVQVYDVSVARRGNTGKMNASLLPGWAYSRALALYAEVSAPTLILALPSSVKPIRTKIRPQKHLWKLFRHSQKWRLC